MLYEGNMGIHEFLAIDGFADWVLYQPEELISLPLFELLSRFHQEKQE